MWHKPIVWLSILISCVFFCFCFVLCFGLVSFCFCNFWGHMSWRQFRLNKKNFHKTFLTVLFSLYCPRSCWQKHLHRDGAPTHVHSACSVHFNVTKTSSVLKKTLASHRACSRQADRKEDSLCSEGFPRLH